MTTILDPTSERSVAARPRLARPESLEGLRVGLLDIAKAKALLAEAGYPDGFKIKIDTLTEAPFSEIAQSIRRADSPGTYFRMT